MKILRKKIMKNSDLVKEKIKKKLKNSFMKLKDKADLIACTLLF